LFCLSASIFFSTKEFEVGCTRGGGVGCTTVFFTTTAASPPFPVDFLLSVLSPFSAFSAFSAFLALFLAQRFISIQTTLGGGDSASSLLASQSGVSVGDLNVELQGSLDDGLAGAETNGGTDLSGVLSVVNEKEFELLDVVNGELEESRGQLVSGCASSLVTDVGHQLSALVLPSDSVVNSTGLSPGFPDTHEAVGLKASEFVDDFLDLLLSINRGGHLGM